jgi:adenylate kinase family enzyme
VRTILLGNAGAGKSTLARNLMVKEIAAWFSLDKVAFSEGAIRRPLDESITDATRFIENHESWIIEGCYADIIAALLPYCEKLIFLNPGIKTCIDHCKQRPWEPEKFESREAQDQQLENLIDWVSSYETRRDEYGLQRHRALFKSFTGEKVEFTTVSSYSAALST